MNKIMFLIGLCIIIAGCGADPGIGDDNVTRKSGGWYSIHEITIDGKTHEYLHYDRGLCHYPECKYCLAKQK